MLAVNRNRALIVLLTVALFNNPMLVYANLLGIQSQAVQTPYVNQWNSYNAFRAPQYRSLSKQDRNAAYATMGLMALLTFFNIRENNKMAEKRRELATAQRRDEMTYQQNMLAEIHRHKEEMLRLELAMKNRGMDQNQVQVILNNPNLMNAIARTVNNGGDVYNTISVPDYGYFSSEKDFNNYNQQLSQQQLNTTSPELLALEERIKASYSRLQQNVSCPKTTKELQNMLHCSDRRNNTGRDIMIYQCNLLINDLNEYYQATGAKFKGFDALYGRTQHLKEALCRYNPSNETTLCRLSKEFTAYRRLAN